jgi:hypothetical protein
MGEYEDARGDVASGNRTRLVGEGRKLFFFEKKNQKTFDNLAPRVGWLRAKVTKVFCFFFSKKKTFPSLMRSENRQLPVRGRA